MPADLTVLIRKSLADELDVLLGEIRQLVEPLDEAAFWKRPMEPSNSVGHLVLHLTGNLSHFVGGQLGSSGYVRDREREFTESNVPTKEAALRGLEAAVAEFRRVVEGLSAEQLAAPHPTERLGLVLPGLLHLVAHFALHRGQISYLTRLVKA